MNIYCSRFHTNHKKTVLSRHVDSNTFVITSCVLQRLYQGLYQYYILQAMQSNARSAVAKPKLANHFVTFIFIFKFYHKKCSHFIQFSIIRSHFNRYTWKNKNNTHTKLCYLETTTLKKFSYFEIFHPSLLPSISTRVKKLAMLVDVCVLAVFRTSFCFRGILIPQWTQAGRLYDIFFLSHLIYPEIGPPGRL